MAFLGNDFDIERIQKKFNLPSKSINNCSVKVHELRKIYQNYKVTERTLDDLRTEILSVLNRELTGNVHSIRCRIKDADHLIEKIIRNVNSNPDKYSSISLDNYNKIITDLIGVRIIILDKRDWRTVHNSLLNIFKNNPEIYVKKPEDIILNYDRYADEASAKEMYINHGYHAERPVVYITSEDDREIYRDEFLRVDNSKSHYRSLHYIIRYKSVYFEIQVRTLFEEGWLEFDHRIKYPYDQNNKKKQDYAGMLSNLAIAADSLISFYDEKDFSDAKEQAAGAEEELKDFSIDKAEEQNLEEKIKRLF